MSDSQVIAFPQVSAITKITLWPKSRSTSRWPCNLWLFHATHRNTSDIKPQNVRARRSLILMPVNPPLESEPLKVTAQGLHHYACTTLRAPETRKQLCTEMSGSFVGPMPIEDFLENFMPVGPERMPSIPLVDFSEVAAARSETKMYRPLVRRSSNFTPSFQKRPLT